MHYYIIGIESLPGTFDALFTRYAGSIPIAYVRALTWNESRQNPRSISETGAVGLFQIVDSVREDYNKRHGTKYSDHDLLDPEKNAAVGLDLLNRIMGAYQSNYPAALSPAWNDRRYVELLTLGWNAGYSNKAGVQAAVGKLLAAGYQPQDISAETVRNLATQADSGLAKTLASEAKMRYSKKVTADYFRESRTQEFVAQAEKGEGATGAIIVASIAFTAAFAAAIAKGINGR